MMNIPLHAVVRCVDGDFGHLTCLIVNPINQEITHFVVNDRRFMGREHIVPVSFISTTSDDVITVNRDRATLVQQPDFVEYEFNRLDGAFPYCEHHIYWPVMLPLGSMGTVTSLPIEHLQIPIGELAVRRGMTVYAAIPNQDGEMTDRTPIGQVEAFVADSKTAHITHLILRKGHFWGEKDVTIPVSEIRKIDTIDVELKLTKSEIEGLPFVPVKAWMPLIT